LEIFFLVFLSLLFPNTQDITAEIDSIGPFFFLAILSEEFLKYILIYKSIAKSNIVLNSLLFGFGFSILEISFIYWDYKNGYSMDPIGILGILIVHISTAMLMGYFVGKNRSNFIFSLFFGFIPAILIHTTYNIFKATDNLRQKEFAIVIIMLLIFMDIFLLIRSRNSHEIKAI